ncbi:PREDICTED: uncharacterized protein LOC108360819 isoform X2 [Rhagoletis zephyria]|uniref:uncharacterized protein LOC108360819 isoform X2 n=1 Tax=Rhagoletis zephyria TaxID=28612 RepID=UPI0008118E25|nr:PREDICTED: uncharacterized protein LOC108360819 isoform X2 [Rhagoletis zephyria]
MCKIVTTRQQYSCLLEMLNGKPDIAQGFTRYSKEEVTSFWENVAKEPNSIGPPIKDVSTWKKVWCDWKCYVKRKLMENKREQTATGGGRNRQHSFTDLEEGVIKRAALQVCTSGGKNTVSVGLPEDPQEKGPENDADVSMVSEACSSSLPLRTSTPQKRTDSETLNVLREQVQMQYEFFGESKERFKRQEEKLEDIASSVRRLCRLTDKTYELKKSELAEMRRHNLAYLNLVAEKNRIKQEMLEIELRKLYLLDKNKKN